MDHLHWQCLLVKPSAIATLDCTCLGHLGQCNTDRIVSFYVAPPKVAKVSTMVTVASHCPRHYHGRYRSKLRQCKYSFNRTANSQGTFLQCCSTFEGKSHGHVKKGWSLAKKERTKKTKIRLSQNYFLTFSLAFSLSVFSFFKGDDVFVKVNKRLEQNTVSRRGHKWHIFSNITFHLFETA